MSATPTPTGTPPPGTPQRRREERYEFRTQAAVEVTAPAWAITTQPFLGRTENLTTHGVKVNFMPFPRDVARRWREAMERYERLTVRVELAQPSGGVLVVEGQIVWFLDEEAPDTGSLNASAGVLFDILRDAERRGLRRLLTRIEGEADQG